MPTSEPLSWTLRAIARLEAADVRRPRLTEPGLERWHRLARRLGLVDFIRLLHDDLATAFPVPFDLSRWDTDPLTGLTEEGAAALIREAVEADSTSSQAFLRQACRDLGLPPGGDIADLPKIQAHQVVVELPGVGGRIAAQQFLDHGINLERNVRFVADTDAERLAVGLAIVECRAAPPVVMTTASFLGRLSSGERVDRVFGVSGHQGAQGLVERASELGHSLDVRWT